MDKPLPAFARENVSYLKKILHQDTNFALFQWSCNAAQLCPIKFWLKIGHRGYVL